MLLGPPAELRVYSLPPVLLTSPYLDQLYGHMPKWVAPRRVRPVWRGLIELVSSAEPSLLHLHFFDELCQRPRYASTLVRTLGFLSFLTSLRMRQIPIVWTAHNALPHETFYPGWASRLYTAVARRSSAIIAHSAAAASQIDRQYAPPLPPFVIPHGNYIGLAGPSIAQEEARSALKLEGQTPVFLVLGTLRPYKGLEALFDAFAQLPPGSARLVVVGGAKIPAYLERLQVQARAIPGITIIPQHVPEQDLPIYLGAADVVVLPYQHVLTSGILLWAMSYRRPVIAPAFGPIAELVSDGKEGLLYAPDQPRALQAALERALTLPNLVEMGHAAFQRVRPFTWSRIAAQTALVYADVMTER